MQETIIPAGPPTVPASIPFFKPNLGEEEIEEVIQTLRSGWLTTGPKTKQFEADFSQYLGLGHSVAVNSCTAALHIALEAVGLREGQGVLLPTMTFAATAEVVRYFKATPLLVDCRSEDLNMDLTKAGHGFETARARGVEVPVVIPMHYGGQIGEVPDLLRLAHRHGMKIVEDAAHCLPGKYRETPSHPWRSVGSFSEVSCYSFYANKCITTGEGGMACTNQAALAERMRIMALHGISRDAWKRFMADGSWYYEIVAPGFKYNLTDIAAAIGIHQLRKADELHARRVWVAGAYERLLSDIEELELPREFPNRLHSWHLYVVRLNLNRLRLDRAAFVTELKRRGIGTSVHWMPLHMHPYYRETYGFKREDFPVAASMYDRIISLPIFPDMTEAQVEFIAAAIRDIIARNLKGN